MIHRKSFIAAVLIGCIATGTGVANAATLDASVVKDTIQVGETTSVALALSLEAGEVASVFEGRFDLLGLGLVADANLVAGGPTWTSSFGNISGSSQAILSLTSDNQGGDRLVGSLQVTGVHPGIFEVALGDPTFAASDITTPPFLEDVNITNPIGEVLGSVQVVPIPAAVWLFGSGLLGLIGIAKRKKVA